MDANPATRRRRSRIAKWGFEAGRGESGESRAPINARAETVASTRIFRDAFVTGRCVVPASGFYEWANSAEGGKQPYYIHPRHEEPTLPPLMVFAAILTANAEGRASCAILTRPASASLLAIHDRMPVILGSKQLGPWLLGDAATARETLEAARSRTAFDLRSIAVSNLVNDVRNDEPRLIAPEADSRVDPS